MKRKANLMFILVLSCLTLTADLVAGDFLPLTPGNRWIYQDAASGQAFTIEVGMTQYLLNDHVYHALKGYTPRALLVRVNNYGNIVFWDDERETDVLLTSFEIVPWAWFEAPRRECPQMGQPQERRVAHDGPAGTWSALEIRYRSFACADGGDLSEQFAENIGMLQRVVNTIAGPRTFNLVHANLGTQTIAAGQSGGFTVTALPGTQPDSWIATLRIHQTLSSDLRLHFASSQEFDVRLRDAEGNIVWTWSADKLFTQEQHELRLSGRWQASVTVPLPAVPEGASPFFTLEAWLTNAEREPRFATVATVYVPITQKAGSLLKN